MPPSPTRAGRSIIDRVDLRQVQALTPVRRKEGRGGAPGRCAPVRAALARGCEPAPSSSRAPAPEEAAP